MLLEPYVRPRPFQANKQDDDAIESDAESDSESDDHRKADPRTPRGVAFWRIHMKSLHHNTRGPSQGGLALPVPDDEILEVYLGIVHTSPGMLVPDIKYILDAAAELVPENKPIVIGGDWYIQRGARASWAKLQDHETWQLGLPHGTTNYKPGKVCQTADHGLFNKEFVSLDGTPIRTQPTARIPYEGFTGDDRLERNAMTANTSLAREVKESVGSDHTNVLMTLSLHPDGKTPRDGTAQPRTTSEELVARLKRHTRSGLASKISLIPRRDTIDIDGLHLHVNHTLGNGNCFYHAVFECLMGVKSTNDCQRQVRTYAVSQMVTNPVVQTHLFGEIPDVEAMQGVAAALLEDGLWTDDFTASFIAEAMNLEIHVLRPDGSLHYVASPSVAGPNLRLIYMVFNGAHFDSCTAHPLVNTQ